jgi:hypothetical protein
MTMTDESTLPQGGSEALPEATTATPAPPRSDAEAALQQGRTTPPDDAAQKAERDEADRKKNRTKEYIDRQNRRIADQAAEIERLKSSSPAAASPQGKAGVSSDEEPTLEDHDWDIQAFNKAHARWAVDQAFAQREQSSRQAEDGRRQQEITAKYEQRLADFTDTHPDFVETVGSIPYQLSPAVQAAIMAHERGPEIAYHLGNNDDDAFNLSNVLPHVAAAAVERLAKRITAAPQQPESSTPAVPEPPAKAPPKPVTRAPQPAATLTGRTPTETPPEKLTDDEWYRRDTERRRKR